VIHSATPRALHTKARQSFNFHPAQLSSLPGPLSLAKDG